MADTRPASTPKKRMCSNDAMGDCFGLQESYCGHHCSRPVDSTTCKQETRYIWLHPSYMSDSSERRPKVTFVGARLERQDIPRTRSCCRPRTASSYCSSSPCTTAPLTRRCGVRQLPPLHPAAGCFYWKKMAILGEMMMEKCEL